MPWLRVLSLSGQTLTNLDFLVPLLGLGELHFLLGGTTNLAALPRIGKIERLSFLRVRQLRMEHLLPINLMQYLKELKFDQQPHLTNLDWLSNQNVKTEVVACRNFIR
jgi:hypothetical protein